MATAHTPTDGTPTGRAPTREVAPRRSDRSPWNWLLLVGIVVPLIVPLYNAIDPKLGAWPRFYWLQLALVALGVLTTFIVYRMTRRSPEERRAAQQAVARDAARRQGPDDDAVGRV
jgi:type VI protein secretion system component VasK